MNPTVTFLTGNRWRHDEARRLLSGVDVAWARLSLQKPAATDLRDVARGRVLDGYRQLGSPCFTENTGLFLEGREGQTGADFKRLLAERGEAEAARQYAGARGVARVVVAYTADGRDVHLFEGESEGEMAPAPRGEGGYGWDRCWVPAGYGRTLAELATSKYLVNMRHAPFVALRGLLRDDVEGGVFEAHVTVRPCARAAFAEACDRLGVKCLFIELPRGAEADQPMTVSHHRGALADAIDEVHGLARELLRAGFTVTRTKIEAVGRHPSLHQTAEAAARSPAGTYFEHHANITLPPGADLDEVDRL
ncbi:MAG TPA: non-canonical purine NTP pyrophosphatase, partial [Polyangiaceae bacterium]|nr:non-canonical purine NTP pyrophosphatase [Polyangiaceae bacterium]